jgi:hypothetical protein
MSSNAEILRKAQMALGDLDAGGKLPPNVARQFVRDTAQEAPLLRMMRTVMMDKPKDVIPKITIIGRVAHAVQEATALPFEDRTGPVTSQVEIETEEMVAEVPLNDSIIEDNVEKKGLFKVIEELMRKQIAFDVQENFVSGDTNSADQDLALFDGLLKLVVSNDVPAGAANWSVDLAEQVMSVMPEKYLDRDEANMRFLGAAITERKYRKGLTDRETQLGDLLLERKRGSSPMGIPMVNISGWPTDTVAANRTTEVLMNPKQFIGGWHRNIRMEMERSARARLTTVVFSYRVGCALEEELATATATNVAIPT